jgi:hypothetical protein
LKAPDSVKRRKRGIVVAPFTPPLFTASAPQLEWADFLVICAGLLLAAALFLLTVSWERHWVWWLRLSALVPLAASVAAEVAAQHLYDTYASWAAYLSWGLPGVRLKQQFVDIVNEITRANNEATVLGWVGVIVTVILLAVTLVGWWRLDGVETSRQSR